jgi:hypothetical protein
MYMKHGEGRQAYQLLSCDVFLGSFDDPKYYLFISIAHEISYQCMLSPHMTFSSISKPHSFIFFLPAYR